MKKKLSGEQAKELARAFIWNRTEDHPVYPLDDDGEIDWRLVRDGDYHWNILEELKITEVELLDTIQPLEDCYTVEISGVVQWSDVGEPEEFTVHVYVEYDCEPDQEYDFDFDPVG